MMTFTAFISVPMVPTILVRAAGNRVGRASAPRIGLDTGNPRVQNGRPVPVPVRGSGLNPYGLTRGLEKTRGSSNPSGIPAEQGTDEVDFVESGMNTGQTTAKIF
jgi:hypothetical protein